MPGALSHQQQTAKETGAVSAGRQPMAALVVLLQLQPHCLPGYSSSSSSSTRTRCDGNTSNNNSSRSSRYMVAARPWTWAQIAYPAQDRVCQACLWVLQLYLVATGAL